jgi:hypothetical protein
MGIKYVKRNRNDRAHPNQDGAAKMSTHRLQVRKPDPDIPISTKSSYCRPKNNGFSTGENVSIEPITPMLNWLKNQGILHIDSLDYFIL